MQIYSGLEQGLYIKYQIASFQYHKMNLSWWELIHFMHTQLKSQAFLLQIVWKIMDLFILKWLSMGSSSQGTGADVFKGVTLGAGLGFKF